MSLKPFDNINKVRNFTETQTSFEYEKTKAEVDHLMSERYKERLAEKRVPAEYRNFPWSAPNNHKNENWMDVLMEAIEPPNFVNTNIENFNPRALVLNLAIITYEIGEKILEYEQFLTDGASGVLVEYYLSELFWKLSKEHSIKSPPKEVAFAGGNGILDRVESIAEIFRNEGVDPNKKTLIITDMISSGSFIYNFLSYFTDFKNLDIASLSTSERGREVLFELRNAKLFTGELFSGEAGQTIYKIPFATGFQKDEFQTEGYLTASPDVGSQNDLYTGSEYSQVYEGDPIKREQMIQEYYFKTYYKPIRDYLSALLNELFFLTKVKKNNSR